jgi:16S rRNA (uracil1498-N3)-methyltransferase
MTGDRVRRAYLAQPPNPGGRAVLDPEESHHLSRVLRVRTGDSISVFDGRGGEWDARVDEVARSGVAVILGEPRQSAVEPPVAVQLVQAFVRPEKVEWILQKGTEIGVTSFRIVPSSRAEAPAPSASRIDRYRRILLEACKQSGRRVVPELAVGCYGSPPDGGLGILLDTAASAPPVALALAGPRYGTVGLAVGPEGGFDDDEIASLADSGWVRSSLGPRVLRTETAGAVAASIVLFAWGDLGAVRG